MLDRESQRLDLEEISFAEQAIEIDTQGMSSQFGQKPSAQPVGGGNSIPGG